VVDTFSKLVVDLLWPPGPAGADPDQAAAVRDHA
jgi:hypothetical protein